MAPATSGEPPTRLERPLSGEVTEAGEHNQKKTAADIAESATEPESALTKRNREQSPLLRLPGELRNRIYEYSLGGYDVHASYAYIQATQESLRDMPSTAGKFIYLANLERVCKQLRKETKLLPYALNNFYFNTSRSLLSWSGKLSPAAKSEIRWVRFEMIMWGNDELFRKLSTFRNLEKIPFAPYWAEKNLREFEAKIAEYGGKWQVVRGGRWYWDKG